MIGNLDERRHVSEESALLVRMTAALAAATKSIKIDE